MRRFLFLMIIILAALGYYGYRHPLFLLRLDNSLFQTQDKRLLQTETIISLSYQLSRERWTEFSLAPATDRVRGLSNCIVAPAGVKEGEGQNLRYAIDYQLLAKEGEQVLAQGTYHFQSKVSLFADSKGGDPLPASLLAAAEEIPGDGRIMQLNLKGLPLELKEKRMRFKLASTEAPVLGVLLRVYTRRQTVAKEGANLWNRLHKFEQDRLAKGNLYSRDLLSPQEIDNVMRSLWEPAGPAGIPNRDFTIKRLYVRKDVEDMVQEDDREPFGLYADSRRAFTLAIPEEGKSLRFLFSKGAATQAAGQPGRITLNWYGKLAQENETIILPWLGEGQELNRFFKGGMIEILTDSPLQISVFDQGQDGLEIFPEPLFAKAYLLGPEKDLSYTIRHLDHRQTPLRITLRNMDVKPNNGQPLSLHYSLLGADGRVVREEAIPFVPHASLYDRPAEARGEMQISDPEHLYLLVPEEVTAIRFQSSDTLLLALANRPPDFVKKTRVPEDSFLSSFSRDMEAEASWLTFPPLDFRELEKENRALSLLLQYRPPTRTDEILAGQFLWEAFRPEGKWRGSYLLVPRQENSPLRAEALNSTFQTVPAGREMDIELVSLPGLTSIRPRLIFLRKSKEPGRLDLSVDGQAYFSQDIIGRQGIVDLPPLPIGKHRLRITADLDGKFLFSNLLSAEPYSTLRFAYRLDGKGITFHYPKGEGAEVLSFFFYGVCGNRERTGVEVDFQASSQAMGPFTGLTQTRRVYDLRPGKAAPLPILHNEAGCVDQGQHFYFPFGDDLPAGTYPVTVRASQGGQEGFLLMYRVTPGQKPWQRFLREEY